ncbi:MAG: peptidoglycan DD-metalloendopeptidase family protein [Pseudohongiellaceae bacterium]|nr:peptidoglycan DD-metalloendopeptidase family protein [Pseudohongiellaceae bacterium]
MNKSWLSSFRVSVLLGTLLLSACAGRYEAPLSDQSSTLERSPAPIYSTSGNAGSSGVVSAPGSSGSSAGLASSRGATANPGVRVQPAEGVTIIPAQPTRSVSRRGISRAPLASTGAPTPSGSAAGTPAASTPSSNAVPSTHTVAPGETLYSIAWQYSLDHRALAVANQLSAPYTIYPNQQLRLDIGAVSNSAVQNVAPVPAAPAGTASTSVGERPSAAVAQRRTGNIATREVEGITWQWPIEGRVIRSYSASSSATSRGIDISGRRGQPVYAAADGDVVYSGSGIQGQGDLIIIRHSARHLSAYSHNSAMLVNEGARIQAGDKIGEVGVDANGTELIHFEVRVDGAPVDPARYLPRR